MNKYRVSHIEVYFLNWLTDRKMQAKICLKVVLTSLDYHSVPEQIWIKGSYSTKWLLQGERGPPKDSKSRWIEILHGGSQFTLWFLKIKIFQNFSDHSEIFFCFTIHKKLNKSCSLKNFFLFLKKKIIRLKKTLKKNFVSGTQLGGFQSIVILTP